VAYAFVAEAQANASAAGTSISIALGTNPTAGNLLHVVGHQFLSAQTLTFSDSLGNSYSTTQSVSEAAIASTLSDGYAENITGGANTVTVTFGSSAGRRGIYVVELSGLKTSSVLDGNGASTDTGNNPTDNTTCTNTSQPGVMLSFVYGIQTSVTIGAGMTLRTSGIWSGIGSAGLPIFQYRDISSVASHTANAANPSLSRQVSVSSLYLEDTGGGGGGPTYRLMGQVWM
jgi:hypothetical protein